MVVPFLYFFSTDPALLFLSELEEVRLLPLLLEEELPEELPEELSLLSTVLLVHSPVFGS